MESLKQKEWKKASLAISQKQHESTTTDSLDDLASETADWNSADQKEVNGQFTLTKLWSGIEE